MILHYAGESNVIMRVLKRWKKIRVRVECAMLVALKMEEEVTSQGFQVAITN